MPDMDITKRFGSVMGSVCSLWLYIAMLCCDVLHCGEQGLQID